MIVKSEKIQTLLDALPYIKEFRNKIVVIKYGGSAQTSPELQEKFAQDITLLQLTGIKPVVVHGGGAKISNMLNKLDIPSKFVDGHRVTCKDSMKVVEMVLSGDINKNITSLLNHHGTKAIGISGKDSNCIEAIAKDGGKFGYTGAVTSINSNMILDLIDEGFVPVIAPIADSAEPNHPGFNINADLAASKIAASLNAKKVIFMTDIVGVLDKEKNLLSTLTKIEIDKYKADETIFGGMIPKVDACLEAIDEDVEKAHIIDGRIEHSILLELFTSEGIGTVIKS
ncbi:MAG: acetylglutamate kinase [Epsilonproteobacteria bacterium]|nr:MAG: acetylglutamate kinase [Campylobacterota bacterium]